MWSVLCEYLIYDGNFSHLGRLFCKQILKIDKLLYSIEKKIIRLIVIQVPNYTNLR